LAKHDPENPENNGSRRLRSIKENTSLKEEEKNNTYRNNFPSKEKK